MTPVAGWARRVAVLGAAALAYGGLIEPRWFRLRRERLTGILTENARRPLRVLLLTDTHFLPRCAALGRFVDRLAEVEADLVVAGGDLVGGRGGEEPTVRLLARLTARGRPGVAVLGSSDHYAPTPKSPHRYLTSPHTPLHGPPVDTDRLRNGLVDAGWEVLEDRRTIVATPAGPVEVAGLRDPHLPTTRLPPRQTIAARTRQAAVRLGVVHAPYRQAVSLLTDAGYRLVLAGHTHGGQLRLPGVGALVTNCDLPAARARGTSPLLVTRPDELTKARATDPRDRAWLHVSAGLGQSRYAPVRFACPPEASLLELV